MYGPSDLSHHLVSEDPHPLYIGEMPFSYDDIPGRVAINASAMTPAQTPGKVILAFPMVDVDDLAFLPDRSTVERFLDAAHAFAQYEPTYWHCHAGLNRSGLLVAAYLCKYRGGRIDEVIAHLRERRSPLVLSNGLFERSVRDWYSAPDPGPTAGATAPRAAAPRFDAWRLLRFGRKD